MCLSRRTAPWFRLLSATFLAVILPALPAPADAPANAYAPRLWTSSTGDTVKARLLALNGENILLALEDGELCDAPKTLFSPADLAFLNDLAAQARAGTAGLVDLAAPPEPQAGAAVRVPTQSLKVALDWYVLERFKPTTAREKGSVADADYAAWLRLRWWLDQIERIPEDHPSGAPEALAPLVADRPLTNLLFLHLHADDNMPEVLTILQKIRQQDPAAFQEFRALAVAVAIVFDQPPPNDWPHRQVKNLKLDGSPPERRFAFWVEAQRANLLKTDLRKLPPDELKFVVDCLLEESERKWAQQNVKEARPNFAFVFNQITYDNERIRKKQYEWPHDAPYKLEELKKRGGICVDQAVYASMSGKALGIPTIFFRGLGRRGGHAWFGYNRGDSWDMDAGRFERDNYSVGTARDPQTWRDATDHEVLYLSQGFRDKPQFLTAMRELYVARLLAKKGRFNDALAAAEAAIAGVPSSEEAWSAKASILREKPDYIALRSHAEAAVANFTGSSFTDLRVKYLKTLAECWRDFGRSTEAETIEKKILSENRFKRIDLSIDQGLEQVKAACANEDWEVALKHYRQLIRELGPLNPGMTIAELTRPFLMRLIESKRFDIARKAVAETKAAFNLKGTTSLDKWLDEQEKL